MGLRRSGPVQPRAVARHGHTTVTLSLPSFRAHDHGLELSRALECGTSAGACPGSEQCTERVRAAHAEEVWRVAVWRQCEDRLHTPPSTPTLSSPPLLLPQPANAHQSTTGIVGPCHSALTSACLHNFMRGDVLSEPSSTSLRCAPSQQPSSTASSTQPGPSSIAPSMRPVGTGATYSTHLSAAVQKPINHAGAYAWMACWVQPHSQSPDRKSSYTADPFTNRTA
ncbi:hypothetical protein BD414DRAFT_489246 [Trametes punicea]|nr:hypothetical protein BD414DRAFT_489246 [Trametes punicea]